MTLTYIFKVICLWVCKKTGWRITKSYSHRNVPSTGGIFSYMYLIHVFTTERSCAVYNDLRPWTISSRSFAHDRAICSCQNMGQKQIRPGAPQWDLINIWSHFAEFPLLCGFWCSEKFQCISIKLLRGFISILKDIFVLIYFWSYSAYFPPLPVLWLVEQFLCICRKLYGLDWAQI